MSNQPRRKKKVNLSDQADPGWLNYFFALILTVWTRTWRWRLHGHHHIRAGYHHGKPAFVGYMHGRVLMMTGFSLRTGGPPFGTFSSPTRDGRLIADTVAALGITPVYGSPEHGGPRALIRILRLLKQRPELLMTVPVDGGSKGPRGQVKPGVTLLAEKSGGWILPVASSAKPSIILNSWDRMLIPAPFATVHVVVGRPILVPPGCGEGPRRLLQQRLLHLQRDCDRMTGIPQIDLVAPPRRRRSARKPASSGQATNS